MAVDLSPPHFSNLDEEVKSLLFENFEYLPEFKSFLETEGFFF